MTKPAVTAASPGAVLIESPPFELAAGVLLLLVVRCRSQPDGGRCAEPVAGIVATAAGTQWLAFEAEAADATAVPMVDNDWSEHEITGLAAAVGTVQDQAVALFHAEWSAGQPKTPVQRVAVGRVVWQGRAARFEPGGTDQGITPSSRTG